MDLFEAWLILMVTINTIQNLIVFFVGRKFKREKKKSKTTKDTI